MVVVHTVTIVARNFLPRARVLARTYRRHNPQDEFSIFLVDAEPGEVQDGPDYRVVTPADLSLSAPEFERMALIYNVTELCTAIKPWALELLLDRGAPVATYLDPDIAVYDLLAEIEKLSLEHGIVLTPHTVEPMPRDGLTPTEAQIMAAGIYNLGFVAVDQTSRPMLEWWQERLLRDCITAPAEMLFVDQRWMDLVPGYFRHTVLTDPTYNVAYWNLDSRELVREGDAVHVQGHGQLRFFHFSGYEPSRPWVLCKYHEEKPRVVLSEHPVVHELCQEYAGWITDPELGGRGRSAVADAPYRFDRLPDGLRVSTAMRSALRRALLAADEGGAGAGQLWRDSTEVRDWFLTPIQAGSRTNRYLLALWESRPDLRASFPFPLGIHGEALLRWAWQVSRTDTTIAIELLPAWQEVGPTELSDEAGVNLAGYFTAEMGVGEMGRMLVDGARAAGLPCATVLNTRTLSRQLHDFVPDTDPTRYAVTIAAVNADEFPTWSRDSDPALAKGYTIGMWAWEVEEFSGFDAALGMVDEVWTLSDFSREAIAAATDKPVHVIPLPIRQPGPAVELDRVALGVPEGPYFLFAFDYFSIFERKNPLGLVDAFRRAFPDGDGPALVIKSVNGSVRRADRERLRAAVADRPDIVLLEQYVEHAQLGSLMAECLAYVSLHRSEGYGLTMAEAMARGRPVIATAYSGNVDFMDEDNSLLVPFTLVPVHAGSGPYPLSTRWADPDRDVAAAHLRWVVENPEAAAELGRRAAESVRETGAIERTAEFVRTRVEEALTMVRSQPFGTGGSAAADPERAIKQVRRMLRQPGASGRSSKLARYDEEQRARLLTLLQAVGLVRRRADRGMKVAQRTRTDLRKLSTQVRDLSIQLDESGARVAHVDRLAEDVDELRQRLRSESGASSDSGAHLRSLNSQVGAMGEDLTRLSAYVAALSGDADASVQALIQDVRRLEAERSALRGPAGLAHTDETGSTYLGYTDPGEVPAARELLRADEQQLLERLRGYVSMLAGHGPVLDIACGRGELLRVLAEAGVPASGVDLDEAAVAEARAQGVEASVGDGVEVAEEADPGSLGAVVAIRLVELLDVDQVRSLLGSAHEALREGGVLLAETVNPHATGALGTIWRDLGLARPLSPESLLVLAKESGFSAARIVFPDGSGELEDDLRGCAVYALLATR